ncbi:hypothetical protein RFI_00796 [Reticulomyxa filosa]|uniref:Uncharacterized protein n=1 Tax=Reticulomyxa filosa TaxID=46433 RepID=X6PDT0_RETFI|nr:hypothetical protein RFI_00796 [Reticulomyxa filosa]|eukprot:ETO36263.1 hypothetical protein RFI_00796 [Reticulomyxa filosa]
MLLKSQIQNASESLTTAQCDEIIDHSVWNTYNSFCQTNEQPVQQTMYTISPFHNDGNTCSLRHYTSNRTSRRNSSKNKASDLKCMFERHIQNNQKIIFDLDHTGQWLISGGHNHALHVFDCFERLSGPTIESDLVQKPQFELKHECRAVSSGVFHPTLTNVIATTCGERVYKPKQNTKLSTKTVFSKTDSSSDSDSDVENKPSQNSLFSQNVNGIFIWSNKQQSY